MKKILTFLVLLVGPAWTLLSQQPQIQTGTRTGAAAVRVAVPEFQVRSTDEKTIRLAGIFNQALWDDLDYSGVVTLVSRSFYPLGTFAQPGDIKPEDWTTTDVDAQFIAFGNVAINGARISIEARLWDLKNPQNREAIGQRLGGEDTDDSARLLAHTFADKIIELIGGGIRGVARTKIAYVAITGLVKEIHVMDYDGSNPFPMTAIKSQAITPSWAPDGEKIAFTSYRLNAPDIEIMSRINRRRYEFPRFGGTTVTPSWSPDGSSLAFATSKDGSDTEIYASDWNGRNARRLTVAKGVDISPVWNPRTGREIAFVSDRSGSQQIYIMDAEGTNVRRLISEGGDAENPAWSPDGQRIAFAWQNAGSSFDIYIHDLASGHNTQLTQNQGRNERPTWAPDGRHLAFASTRTGTSQIFSMLADGTKVRQLTKDGKNEGPAWSGYIGQ